MFSNEFIFEQKKKILLNFTVECMYEIGYWDEGYKGVGSDIKIEWICHEKNTFIKEFLGMINIFRDIMSLN